MAMKQSRGEKCFDVFNIGAFILLMLVMLYPFVNQIAMSLSSQRAVVSGEVNLWPVEFQIKSYISVVNDYRFTRAFMNSVLFTVVQTAGAVFMTAMFAYPISKKNLKGMGILMKILMFSMLFGTGGLIPNYLLIKNLGLVNSYYALWLPHLIVIWDVIILRNFFRQLPESMEESAFIDGAGPIRVFLQIILPLSLAPIAAIGLFIAVSAWNTLFGAVIYLTDSKKKLLQVYLSEILQSFIQNAQGPNTAVEEELNRNIAPESMKAATLLCTTIPIVCIYPLLQKHFVKGMMTGAIKG